MRSFFLLGLCSLLTWLFQPGYAQQSKANLLADLHFLLDAAQARDPAAAPIHLTDIRGLLNISALVPEFGGPSVTDTLTHIEYRLAVGAALQAIGDGHALVLNNPLARADSFYFPLPVVMADNGRLFLMRQCPEYPADLVGKEVTSINGSPTNEVISNLVLYAAADGGDDVHFAGAFLRVNLIPLITAYFGGVREYSVEVAGHESGPLQVQAIRTIRFGEPRHPGIGLSLQPALQRGSNALHLRPQDSAAVLVVTKFSKKDNAFFRRAFTRLEKEGVRRLVLDLRGNTGGARGAAVALTKHLVDTTFGYRLVRPRGQKLRPYLNREGRLFLTMARMKYGLGNFYRAGRSPQGTVYRWRYKPVKNPFHGRVAVITNGLTISAPTMVTSWLKQHTDAVFVGSQAGGGYNGNWGGSFPRITLPKSGMIIHLPAYRVVLDETSTKRDGISPDVLIQRMRDDVLGHEDAALKAALSAVAGTSSK